MELINAWANSFRVPNQTVASTAKCYIIRGYGGHSVLKGGTHVLEEVQVTVTFAKRVTVAF